jgi:hypothetical protein
MAPLPPLITPALLAAIRSQPHLPSHAWYFVTGVTLSILNRPDEIPRVFSHALEKGPARSDAVPGHDEQLVIARKLREALVKAAAIGGLPKVCIKKKPFSLFHTRCYCLVIYHEPNISNADR